jgi:DNA primase small subunit
VEAEQFLREQFKAFYARQEVKEPPQIEDREFGFGTFDSKIAQRHLSFASFNELNDFLRTEVPFYISFSGAYYQFPGRRPVSAKGFKAADLFYEFDADDIETDCKEDHDHWQCQCGREGNGVLESCPECGRKVKVIQWVCPDCLNETKKQSFELMELIDQDLGLMDKGALSINFSGHKGYHIHLRQQAVKGLSKEARIEIVDYLSGHGLSLQGLGFFKSAKKWVCPKAGQSFGLSARLLKRLKEFFTDVDVDELAVVAGIPFSHAKRMLVKREQMLASIESGVLFQLERKTDAFWQNILEHLVDNLKLNLDRQTSIDLVKILRLPETLHGGTGLKAANVSFDALKAHDPLKETLVFNEGEQEVFVKKAPKFYLAGQWFGPFENETVVLPLGVAVYLLAKKAALLNEPKGEET